MDPRVWKLLHIVCGVVFFLGSARSFSAQTIYSQEVIPAECHDTYLEGVKTVRYARELEVAGDARRAYYSSRARKFQGKCAHEFAMGLFDARHVYEQRLMLEYGLELWYESNVLSNREAAIASIKRQFRKRFRRADIDEGVIERFDETSEFVLENIPEYVKDLKQMAWDKQRAMTHGRFVFTQNHRHKPFTLYEYERRSNGAIIVTSKGDLFIEKGTYQKAAERLWHSLERVAKEYLAWQPSVFFGQDSYWYGAFWRFFGSGERSLREVKEQGYFNRVAQIVRYADDLNLEMKPFRKIQNLMLAKERAYLERDIKIYRRTFYSLLAAPLVPVGIAVAAPLFSGAGFTALSGASSFQLASASMYTAANASALVSLGAIATFAGLGSYNAIRGYLNSDKNSPYRFALAMDQIVGATVQSFPLAAALPPIVGSGIKGAQVLALELKALVTNSYNVFKAARALGFRGSLSQLPKLGLEGARWWARTWWKHRRVLGFNYLANNICVVVFEVYSREFILDDEHSFFPVDENGNRQWFNWREYNEQAMVSIGTYAVYGLFSQPALKFNSLLGRVAYAQLLTLGAVSLTQLGLNGGLNLDRHKFELMYGLTYGRWRSEMLRPVFLSDFVTRNAARQTALTVLMGLVLGFSETPMRNHILDEYIHYGITPAQFFREKALDLFSINISDITDEELEQAMKKYMDQRKDDRN